MYFNKSFIATIAAFATVSVASAVPTDLQPGIVSLEEMKAWVAAQDPANITIIGDPFGTLSPRAGKVTVTYCKARSGTICTGPCTVSSGSGVCLDAPGTQCLFATGQVTFCDRSNCGGSCNEFNSCGTRLTNNFCATPGTQSIGIPA